MGNCIAVALCPTLISVSVMDCQDPLKNFREAEAECVSENVLCGRVLEEHSSLEVINSQTELCEGQRKLLLVLRTQKFNPPSSH